MKTLAHIPEAQRVALIISTAIIGVDKIEQVMAQGPEALNARLEAFMRYEATPIGQVHDHIASTMPTPAG